MDWLPSDCFWLLLCKGYGKGDFLILKSGGLKSPAFIKTSYVVACVCLHMVWLRGVYYERDYFGLLCSVGT